MKVLLCHDKLFLVSIHVIIKYDGIIWGAIKLCGEFLKMYPSAEFISFIVDSLKLSSKNPKWQDHQNNTQKDAVGGILLRQKCEAVFKSCYSYQCPNYSTIISLGNYLKNCLNWIKVIFTKILEMALSDLKRHSYFLYCRLLILIVQEWLRWTGGTVRERTDTTLLFLSPPLNSVYSNPLCGTRFFPAVEKAPSYILYVLYIVCVCACIIYVSILSFGLSNLFFSQ